MSNRSYLAATDNDTIYPSAAESGYNPDAQTIAQGVYCVPLLWLGLFRPVDMRSQDFDVHGETVTGVAPVVDVKTALAQLSGSVALYNRMFPGSRFDDYANMLAGAVDSIGLRYVTVEMEEIACMADPEDFYEDFRIALAALNGEESLAEGRDKLIKISEINASVAIPSANCLLDDSSVSDDQIDVHSRIIGCKWIRQVPWE